MWALFLLASSICHGQEVEFHGAGATFPWAHLNVWWTLYSQQVQSMHVHYELTGSTTGRKRIMGLLPTPKPLAFACSDIPLKKSDYQLAPSLGTFPVLGGALVIAVNLPGVEELYLSREALTLIYRGVIRDWDDAILVALNPKATLPAAKIRLVARSTSSGTTMMFTTCLSAFSPIWKKQHGAFSSPKLRTPYGNSSNWPNVELYASSNIDVATLIYSIPYTMGYIGAGDALERNLQIAALENGKGDFVPREDIALRSEEVMGELAQKMNEDLSKDHSSALCNGAYPLTTFSYMIVNMSTSPDVTCDQMKTLVHAVNWSLTSDLVRNVTKEKLSTMALKPKLVSQIQHKILYKISCEGHNVAEWIWADIRRKQKEGPLFSGPAIVLLSTVVGMATLIVALTCYHNRARKAIQNEWLVNADLVTEELELSKLLWMHPLLPVGDKTITSKTAAIVLNDSGRWPMFSGSMARLNEKHIIMFRSAISSHGVLVDYTTSKQLSAMVRKVSHQNILSLVGIVINHKTDSFITSGTYHIYENPQKSSLHYLLAQCPYELNNKLLYSMAMDVARGMSYLHGRDIVHGALDTWVCLLDPNWTVRVANWAQANIAKMLELDVLLAADAIYESEDEAVMQRLVFQHPDSLSGKLSLAEMTTVHDLYSFSMVLTEIFTRRQPFIESAAVASWKEVLTGIMNETVVLPTAKTDIPLLIRKMIRRLQTCSIESFGVVYEELQKESNLKDFSIVDNLLEVVDDYVHKLELEMTTNAKEVEDVVQNQLEALDNSRQERRNSRRALRFRNVGTSTEPEPSPTSASNSLPDFKSTVVTVGGSNTSNIYEFE